jgi:hypothetical protein
MHIFIYSLFIQNPGTKIFPSDFFEPILPKEEKKSSSTDKHVANGSKSIYVSLQKEYEEDRELLELLSPKRNL